VRLDTYQHVLAVIGQVLTAFQAALANGKPAAPMLAYYRRWFTERWGRQAGEAWARKAGLLAENRAAYVTATSGK
jgi:hypothetical protein